MKRAFEMSSFSPELTYASQTPLAPPAPIAEPTVDAGENVMQVVDNPMDLLPSTMRGAAELLIMEEAAQCLNAQEARTSAPSTELPPLLTPLAALEAETIDTPKVIGLLSEEGGIHGFMRLYRPRAKGRRDG
ncbi:MAG: hypothetical protein CMM02_03875 [Rhodopirellula sp.]|jgi:hypothetical protein|nr:hypothetical protein [Rhodopirellula sp.]|tara:strand:- start:371 stop:766 length:396 start_codon:yes stop_codon:yes gene_type:complete